MIPSRPAAGLVATGLAALLWTAAGAGVPEPEGFRGEPYRAPVPATLAGATVIGDAEARALWEGGEAGFVDVLPRTPRPEGLPEGTLWRDPVHETIPGALWLPNVGYEALSEAEAGYLASGLAAASGGDADRPLVVFCLAECWMSWNAAKRAVAAGHTRVLWYPDGIDGWRLNGWPLAPAEPFVPEP